MTTKQTYIYSDAECVLKSYSPPELFTDGDCEEQNYSVNQMRIKQAKSTAVKLKNQAQAKSVIVESCRNHSWCDPIIQPDTIYTVEGYEAVYEDCDDYAFCNHCLPGDCMKRDLATLKRIEPVVEEQESDKKKIILSICEEKGHSMFPVYTLNNFEFGGRSSFGLNKCSRCGYEESWQYDH